MLLADEPTGNLDSANGDEVLTLLEDEVRQQGTTLLMVTHDVDAAARADRVHQLADGHISDLTPPAAPAAEVPISWGQQTLTVPPPPDEPGAPALFEPLA